MRAMRSAISASDPSTSTISSASASERIAGVGEFLARLDARTVHVLDGNRDDAGGDDGGDAAAGGLGGGEAHQHGARALGGAEDADDDFGDDAQLTLGPDDEAQEIQPGGIKMRAAQLHHRAIDEDEFGAEDVVGGDAVFQAMRAAGVHGDVAGDGAGELARRVRGIEEAAARDGAGDGDVGDPGLDGGDAVFVIDRKDAVHARQADDDAVFRGQRAAREGRAGATRDDLDPLAREIAEDG